METQPVDSTITPPKMIPTLVTGFNTVAANIALILAPLLLDVFLWLGPHFSVQSVFQPLVASTFDTFRAVQNTPDMVSMANTTQGILDQALAQFNFASLLRTFPLGIPSLLFGQDFTANPLGDVTIIDIPSADLTLLFWLGLVLVGILLGCLYFDALCRVTSPDRPKFSLRLVMQQYGQVLSFTVVLLIVLTFLVIPAVSVLSLITMSGGGFSQILLLVMVFMGVWLLLPLVFSIHGIFVNKQRSFASITTSIRMVRVFLPGTGMFILTAILLNQGLSLLWMVPGTTNWMLAIGIVGHAFISTGLVAATFVYYRGGLVWMQEAIRRMNSRVTPKIS